MINKIVASMAEAMAGIKDGSTVLLAGFAAGTPEQLAYGLIEQGARDLTLVCNAGGRMDGPIADILATGHVSKLICSFVRAESIAGQRFAAGKLALEIVPQGTLAEKMRAGGAGIPAFFTATGYGTPVGDGKEVRHFNGRPYILEEAITGDFAIVKAWKADRYGNAVYRHTAQNFNPMAATAGRITVMEVEEIVEPGALDPAQIHTPGIYVNRLVQGSFEKRIEQRTVRAG